jgi:hypothetical protein
MSISKIKTGSITTDAITEAKVADGAIENEHLNSNVITGQTELSERAASSDVLLIYDASTGTLKKIQASNVGNQLPIVSSVSPTSVASGDGTGNYTFTITGSGFTAGSADLINDSGTTISFDTVTIDSDTQITGVIAKSSLPSSGEPYDVRATSTNGLRATLENQINIDQSPTFVTASGSLGSNRTSMAGVSVNATDPESAGNVTFELQSGALPPGISIVNTAAEGGTATFTGTFSSLETSNTTYNFTLRAVDAASNTSSRAFSFTALGPVSESFTSSGTFSVPTGLTEVDVLVVGGGGGGGVNKAGGGGAGGLIFMPSYPVTPGGTVSVTVGCGGANATAPGAVNGGTGQDSVFGTLTAKGGGYGAADIANQGGPGGSGGSGGGGSRGGSGGTAIQPTQPGNSGTYGFGNAGGTAPGGAPAYGAGGGGGAGAAGGGANNGAAGAPDAPFGGDGGDGRAYTIADGTTPVYYAGGGGGSYYTGPCFSGGFATGGQGGGGNAFYAACGVPAQPGTANRGGGGGGSNAQPVAGNCSGAGGKGIVIVRY